MWTPRGAPLAGTAAAPAPTHRGSATRPAPCDGRRRSRHETRSRPTSLWSPTRAQGHEADPARDAVPLPGTPTASARPCVIAVAVRPAARSSCSGPRALSWRDHPQPLFVVVAGCSGCAARLGRRSCARRVVLTQDGVRLRNIAAGRATSRGRWCPTSRPVGTLKVWAGDERLTAWAISSQVERPKVASSRRCRGTVPPSWTAVAATRERLRHAARPPKVDRPRGRGRDRGHHAPTTPPRWPPATSSPRRHPAVTTRWVPLPCWRSSCRSCAVVLFTLV